jgi:glutamine synthetase
LTPDDKTALKLEIGRIPEALLDNTDRNRTSPFAFTGNKFELRAVGSSANCAIPMTVLNAIVSEQLEAFKVAVDARIDAGDKKDEAILKELQVLITESKAIRFEGNGYSDEWVEEAARRGLSNLRTTPEALSVFNREEVRDMFDALQILRPEELHARVEVELENYIMKRQIEFRVLLDLARNRILPAVLRHQNGLLENVSKLREVLGSEADAMSVAQIAMIKEAGALVQRIHTLSDELEAKHDAVEAADNAMARAEGFAQDLLPLMDELGDCCSALESIVDDSVWPLPKFGELLFTR